ncbi:hypothetical protein BV210_18840 (plasmid) [Halorientalis sp. IM1011]|uniref:Gfo/Idh/MocA family protein n=1 Tax=Halorientalis sp. IM1011 TaxID=1932360 RepID=UPI00097CD00C|nr:hypothetical protein BV210_18840 [Halorientalis sp. IM1011]
MIAVDVQRLGPPVDRDSKDGVVLDLMIHDIDVVLSTIGSTVERVSAMGTRDRNHVTAQLELADGVVADLTASRVTQEKVRRLAITAEECRVNVDYEAQSVQIHRHSVPEYYESDGDLRYRHESIIERPTIHEAFEAGCDTMTATSDVVTPTTSRIRRKRPCVTMSHNCTAPMMPRSWTTIIRFGSPTKPPSSTTRRRVTTSLRGGCHSPVAGTNFWIPLRINPPKRGCGTTSWTVRRQRDNSACNVTARRGHSTSPSSSRSKNRTTNRQTTM